MANTVVEAAPRPGDPPPSFAEMAADRRRQTALDEASRDLAAARGQLEDAIEHARIHGRRRADRIREAIDDDVADSPWDNIKDWYDANAGWIKTVTKVLSYVAAALAVVALFIPGLNLIVIGLALTVLASQTLLAASGNGSWADVALSVFALATVGVGALAVRALRGVATATRAAGSQAARGAATSAARRSSHAARTAAGRTLSRRTASAAQRRHARRTIDSAKAEAREAGSRAAREVSDAPMAQPTKPEIWKAGDSGSALYKKDIDALRSRFPDDAGVQNASRQAERYYNINRGASSSSFYVDTADKVGEDFNIEPYNDAKGHFKKEVGSTW